MIRLQNKVPQVYVNESRDFQLLLRLYDFLFNGTRFNIKSMENLLSPAFVNDKMLILLATRVGFFPTIEIDTSLLRRIIAAFPYIIKNKGSIKGISLAVSTILKAENSNAQFKVINNLRDYVIEIYTEVELYNKKALIEVLNYVLPVGYDYKIGVFTQLPEGQSTSQLVINNEINYITAPSVSISQIIGDDRIIEVNPSNVFNLANEAQYTHLGDLGTLEIIGDNTYSTKDEYSSDRLDNYRDNIDKRENISNKRI